MTGNEFRGGEFHRPHLGPTVGAGDRPDIDIGPLINVEQDGTVASLVVDAVVRLDARQAIQPHLWEL